MNDGLVVFEYIVFAYKVTFLVKKAFNLSKKIYRKRRFVA